MSRIVSPEASMGFIHEPRIECQIPASSQVPCYLPPVGYGPPSATR